MLQEATWPEASRLHLELSPINNVSAPSITGRAWAGRRCQHHSAEGSEATGTCSMGQPQEGGWCMASGAWVCRCICMVPGPPAPPKAAHCGCHFSSTDSHTRRAWSQTATQFMQLCLLGLKDKLYVSFKKKKKAQEEEGFSNYVSKSRKHKRKSDLVKIKNSCMTENIIIKVKRQMTN